MTQTQKTRLKRRLAGFWEKNGTIFVEGNFRAKFRAMANKKNININIKGWGYADMVESHQKLKELVDACDERECIDLNLNIDCYQIENGVYHC
jgi:hypothetical protein